MCVPEYLTQISNLSNTTVVNLAIQTSRNKFTSQYLRNFAYLEDIENVAYDHEICLNERCGLGNLYYGEF